MKIEFEQGSKEWEAMRERAKNDLYFFNSVVLGFANVFPLNPETHMIAHRFMQGKTGIPDIDDAPYQLLMWPRETGKSTCGTVGGALWLAANDPNCAILIANEKEELASDFLASVKNHLEQNELLRFLFPEIAYDPSDKMQWSATRATVRRDTKRPEATFEVTGVGGTKVGKHYDYILCDDLVGKNAMENARSGSWDIMERTNRWVNQLGPLLSTSAKQKGMKIRFIGTRWWNGDTYEHIMRVFGYDQTKTPYIFRVKLPSGRVVQREVYRQGDLAVLIISAIEKGEAVFPEIWSMERLEKTRWQDPEFFACNLLNDPTDAEVRTFRDEWLRYWDWASPRQISYRDSDGRVRFADKKGLYKIVCVDPAFTASQHSARTAAVVYGIDATTGKRFVLDLVAGKYTPGESLQRVVELAQRWEAQRVMVELVGQQAAYIFAIREEIRKRGLSISVEELRPGGRNKDMRIETLIVPFQNGDIYLHKSQSKLIDDEYRRYRPGARLRDLLDVLAYAEEKIPRFTTHGESGAGVANRRAQKQLDAYTKRRGLKHAGTPSRG